LVGIRFIQADVIGRLNACRLPVAAAARELDTGHTVRRALAAGLSIAALVTSIAVLSAPGAVARVPNAIVPNATAATGSTCYVGVGECSEVPCVEMITGGQATAMTAGPQPVLPARPVRSRCVHPPAPGTATIIERPKTATRSRFGALLAPSVFRGSLAQRIVALSHAVMRSMGVLTSP
jgi:hypothetical protein